jgi:Flp pilus assembly protein TadD/peroxiredoxin
VSQNSKPLFDQPCSRRRFLAGCSGIPAALLIARGRLSGYFFAITFDLPGAGPAAKITCQDGRFHPHYRLPSPIDGILEKVDPAKDSFPSEQLAAQIEQTLAQWTRALLRTTPDLSAIRDCLPPTFTASPLGVVSAAQLRKEPDFEIQRQTFAKPVATDREAFLCSFGQYLNVGGGAKLQTAEFKLTGITVAGAGPVRVSTQIRYDLVSSGPGRHREEKIGFWNMAGQISNEGKWSITQWEFREETRSRAAMPLFVDVTGHTLGANPSYWQQLVPGTDHWRTLLDAACGIDVYGNYGVAVGDIDHDGWDDLYVCQPSGLPNRLYRNTGRGTFEDVTEKAGAGVIDSSPAALFADVNNDGHQDLIVVRESGPLLFLNLGDGTFKVKPNAFKFAHPPEGSFTGAALADYDRDGWLDIYFCLYSYYQGPNRYRYPLPYFDAENGPPNFFFKNNRDGTFQDVTGRSGLDQNNHRYSFACGWCDYNQDGWPDLFVANDFGKKNLYRNNRDGTFTDVAPEAGVEDTGAGMSTCWLDYDNDGQMDLYVADMWTAAGQRITRQPGFFKGAPETVRALYRKHAMGNSLFRNDGKGRFVDATRQAGVGNGGWAWSSDSWDFDHDGFADLYIANGMISGPDRNDLASFFWRQVVSRSPVDAKPSTSYEDGWGAINELIRSDHTWSGYERNIFYINNHDGTFSCAAGIAGLDFIEDSRSFALADVDHDGRLEIILKNRGRPQVRVLHNAIKHLGDSVAFRLRGTKSNRDAIGAKVTVETAKLKQTKFVQAGSGFLSQHTKDLYFGLGPNCSRLKGTVHWPSGSIQHFDHWPVNHRIEITEGSEQITATPFKPFQALEPRAPSPPASASPDDSGIWLVAPLVPPQIEGATLGGKSFSLASLAGKPALLVFWALCSPASVPWLRSLSHRQSRLAAAGLQLAALSVEGAGAADRIRALAAQERFAFPIVLLPADQSAVYNLLFRYMFDRHRDLPLPTSFLLDSKGRIIKVYPGCTKSSLMEADLLKMPRTAVERESLALPFPGVFYGGEFSRSYLTDGVAFAQRGYLNAAEDALLRAVGQDSRSALAHYSLGTLYLEKGDSRRARQELQTAIHLQPDYLLSLNNLGVLAAQQGRYAEASVYFHEVLKSDADNLLAIENLAEIDRSQGRLDEAKSLLQRGLELSPRDPDLNYKMGMLYAQQHQNNQARKFLELALEMRPNFPKAANNLGVLYLLIGHPRLAAKVFREAVQSSPDYDQPYLNLARLYVTTGQTQAAVEILRQLLARQPQHRLARKMLDRLQRN